MSAQILDGKLLAAQIKERLVEEIKQLRNSVHEIPRIFSIVVGNDPASLSYASSQQKAAQSVGSILNWKILKPTALRKTC
jgi:methylenetetrahydrofolate dehydrogenase (NADP+)/methenyltetrahydrofolate cyclohydrolase